MVAANSEKGNSSSSKKKKKSFKKKKNHPISVQKKDFKKNDKCFNCEKQGHFTKDYKAPKKGTTHNVNQVDNCVPMLFQVTTTNNVSG